MLRAYNPSLTERLIRATQANDWSGVKDLLKEGCNPNGHDGFGDTALMWAAALGQREILSLLLEYGARPGLSNRSGDTAPHVAARRKRCDMVAILLKGHKILLTQPNAKNETVFSLMMEQSQIAYSFRIQVK